MRQLQQSLSRSRERMNQNEIFTVEEKVSEKLAEESQEDRHMNQTHNDRLNLGVFGDFNVTVQSQNNILHMQQNQNE